RKTMEADTCSFPPMERLLLKAATMGDATSMKHLELHTPRLLFGTTPQGNSCLHISAAHGHEQFSKDAVALDPSLLEAINKEGETPLLTAVRYGHVSLARVLVELCRNHELRSTVMWAQDNDGCNVLHHAIRSGHRELALELIAAEPALSRAVNKHNESPLFIAAARDFTDVCDKLLEIPDSAHSGHCSNNALHAAVYNGNSVITRMIMEARPLLAREENSNKRTPAHEAALQGRTDLLRVMLEYDWSIGYLNTTGFGSLLTCAAFRGHIDVARELLSHCPDAPYHHVGQGYTVLHQAVNSVQPEFVEFIIGTPQLRNVVNMRDRNGLTALHRAVANCNPRMVAALLLHPDIDVAVLDNSGYPATWKLSLASPDHTDRVKTLNWNEVSMLMLQANPKDAGFIQNIYMVVKNKVTNASRKDAKSLTQTYTSNTSLVAILIATITFAAAFTLPGGYSSDAGSEGLPIMVGRPAFQAFLISDTLAMCSSLSVAFICIIARWGDLEFLLYYRSFTKKLMWFAYMATTTAFATGLYTVVAPRLQWLAVAICVLSVFLPVFTYLLGKWPILKLRYRLGRTFKSEFLDMV
ncbi:hypothetical protein EJB05_30087, partial [Eragrostis curvula]